MAQPTIEAVTAETLPAFAAFLHANLSNARSPAAWAEGLSKSWGMRAPNHGFVLMDEGRIVGGIGAYYAERAINGNAQRVCNITSWCVLENYRKQSMRLAMALVGQPGYHFTDFSPTKVVAGVLQFLKFRSLDVTQAVIINLPWPVTGSQLLTQPHEIEGALRGDALCVYRDHSTFPWLRHLLLGTEGNWCHIIYKHDRYKRLPSARVCYLSNADIFERHCHRLSRHFLARGLATTRVERRFLATRPWPSGILDEGNIKVYLSSTLIDSDIDYLYSETMALDI